MSFTFFISSILDGLADADTAAVNPDYARAREKMTIEAADLYRSIAEGQRN